MNHMVVNAKLTDFFGKIFKIDVEDRVFQKRASTLKSLKFSAIFQLSKKEKETSVSRHTPRIFD